MTIVSKVSLAVAFIVESAVPISLILNLQRYNYFPIRATLFSFSFAKVQLPYAAYLRGVSFFARCSISATVRSTTSWSW